MPKESKPRRRTAAPRPMAMDDSIAHVSSRTAVERRATATQAPAPRPFPEPFDDSGATAPVGSVPSLTAPIPAAAGAPGGGPDSAAPILEDLSVAEASRLIARIPGLVADLRADYSNEHVVFDTEDATTVALRAARERIAAMGHHLAAAIDGHGGPEVDRVCDGWHDAVVDLVGVEVQREHWAATPESIVGAWRRHLGSTPEGDILAISFGYVSRFAIGTHPAAVEIEKRLLPVAIESLVGTNDWSERLALARELSTAEVAELRRDRDALRLVLAEVCGPLRRHYRNTYNSTLGILAAGDPGIRDPAQLSRATLAQLWLSDQRYSVQPKDAASLTAEPT